MEGWRRIGQGKKLSKDVCSAEKGGSLVPQEVPKFNPLLPQGWIWKGRSLILLSVSHWLLTAWRGGEVEGDIPNKAVSLLRSTGQLLVNQNSQLLE